MSVTVKESSFVIDEEHLAAQVNDIREKLPTEGPEVLLDFFLAQTLDPEGIRALEELAAAAEADERQDCAARRQRGNVQGTEAGGA